MAKKRRKQKNSTIFISAIVFLVFVCIYLITPKIYSMVKTSKYEKTQEQLITTISSGNDIEMLITRYAIENNAYVKVQSSDQTKTYQTPVIPSVSYSQSTQTFKLSDGTEMKLDIQYANNDMMELNQVLIMILPISAAILILLIHLFNYLGKSTSKDDFEQFKKITDAMLQFKPNAKLPVNDTNKEKNALAKNINDLYEHLCMSIETYKNKAMESSALEKQTIEALNQATLSINQPIDEVKMILNGLILNEGKFYNQRSYLIEAKMKLEDLQTTLSSQLSISANTNERRMIHVHDYFKKIMQPYELLCLEKRVRIRFKFTKPFDSSFNEFMFGNAFSHLMEFTLKQCESQSNILVSQNEYDIIISYKGAALTEASINRVKENDIHLKELFKTIQAIGLYLDFETTQKKDGMQFVFHF